MNLKDRSRLLQIYQLKKTKWLLIKRVFCLNQNGQQIGYQILVTQLKFFLKIENKSTVNQSLQQLKRMSFIHDIYQKLKIIYKGEKKEIWLVKNTFDGELCVVKLQFNNTENKKSNARTVLHEGKYLQTMQGHLGVPFLFWAGRQESTGVSMLIMERLGKTVDELFKANGQPFTLKTVCQLGINLIKMIFSYHDKGFTHGNLQPSSIQFGVGKKCHILYFNDLIDSSSYIKKGKHIKQKQFIKRCKINQFMSLDRLQGFEGSRRDDIESIIYILIYLLKGSLPWSKKFEKTIFKKSPPVFEENQISISRQQTKQETIKFNHSVSKENSDNLYTQSLCKLQIQVEETTIDSICSGVNNEFKKMLIACKATQFEERPAYNDFIRILEKLMDKNGLEKDDIYDWMIKTDKRLILKREDYKNFALRLSNQDEILENWYLPYESKVDLI